MENPMNNIDIKLVTKRKQYIKWSIISNIKKEKKFVIEQ